MSAVLDAGVEALGWTLLHFVWQGALAGALFALLMKALARTSARLRYAIGLCVFIGLALTPAATFWYLLDIARPAASAFNAPQTVLATLGHESAWWTRLEAPLHAVLPWLVLAWLSGVMLLSWRLARDWTEVRALVRSCTQPLPRAWRDTAERLRITFGIRRPVQVLESALVHVPMVVGWLKPVILIPPAALLGLTPKQLELLVAHEFAHIRRLDYAVNLFQVAVETLLFYHPVVRWMSARIREERELCCDDLVVATSGDKLAYARALAEMEGLRCTVPSMGMAADGGQLISRINRLVALPAPQRGAAHWLLGILLVVTGTTVMTSLHFAVRSFEAPGVAREPAPLRPIRAEAPVQPSSPQMRDAAVADTGAPLPAPEPAATPATAASPVMTAEAPTGADAPMESAAVETARPTPATAAPDPEQPVQTSPEGSLQPDAAPIATRAEAPEPATPDAPAPDIETVEPEAATADEAAPAAEEARLAMLRAPRAQPRPSAVTASPEPAAPPPAVEQAPEGPVLSGGTPLIVTQPDFPRRARLKGLEGAVTVQFTVTRKGRVSDLRVIHADPAGVFDREVTRTVREWRFEPYHLDGAPVERTIQRTIQFQLDPSAPAPTDASCMMVTGSRLCRSNGFSPGRAAEIAYKARQNEEVEQ